MVHVNGSVNFEDAETVMRELAARIPKLQRIPDGETGERKIWIAFQSAKFQAAGGLELVPRGEDRIGEMDEQLVRVADGVDPAQIGWPDLGFATCYEQSNEVFGRLQQDGVIGSQVRFQVEYPSPLACVTTFVDPQDVLRVQPSYEAALFADIDRVIASVGPDRIAVQFDLPVEMGVLEMPEVFATSHQQDLEQVAAGVARCVDRVPADVPVGLHLCYGDYLHRHWKEPESLDMQVRLLNAVAAAASREVSWCAFTVPQYTRDPGYFAPLAQLEASGTDPFLALVPYHPQEQEPGTTEEQMRLVDAHLGQRPWGLCTECGLVNVERDELPALLDLHTDLVERFAAAPRP